MISIIDIKPNHPKLDKHISSYYFVSSNDQNKQETFFHCPHYRTTLNLYFGSNVKLSQKGKEINQDKRKGMISVLTNNSVTQTKYSSINGEINGIVITFNPLGVHHFFDSIDYRKLDLVSFFDPFKVLLNEGNITLETASLEERVEYLNRLFLHLYRPFENNKIEVIVDHILLTKGQVKVAELTVLFDINSRSLLRMFRQYMGCSISQFKQIVKFRHALTIYQSNTNSLTELAYTIGYYDQSDFIHQIKALSGRSPKQLFETMEKFGKQEGGAFWRPFSIV